MAKHSRSEKAFKKRVKVWKDNKEEGKKKANDEKHFSTSLKKLGRITKGNAYAKNGYFQVAGMAARRKIYERATVQKLNYKSSSDNFYTRKLPYSNQAHHILPKDSFSKKLGFTSKELKLLVRVPYDLNHGENIMFLPEDEADCKIHQLPSHRGGHKRYNKLVSQEIKELKSRLKTKEKPPCEKKKGPQMAILADLKEYQDDWWKFLAKAYKSVGKGTVQNLAEHYKLDGEASGV